MIWIGLLAAALGAGVIGGIAGFGSALLLMPICASAFGAAKTVPILTVAMLLGNLSRTALFWRETNWQVVGRYLLGAVPATVLGALLFVSLDTGLLQRLLGVLILVSIPARRWFLRHGVQTRLAHFVPLGGVMGFLSGLVGTVGPINAPFFLSFGLVKGAYLSTESLGAATIHLTKCAVYGRFAALDYDSIRIGFLLGLALVAGAWIGKQVVTRIDAASFIKIVEALLAISGFAMLAGV